MAFPSVSLQITSRNGEDKGGGPFTHLSKVPDPMGTTHKNSNGGGSSSSWTPDVKLTQPASAHATSTAPRPTFTAVSRTQESIRNDHDHHDVKHETGGKMDLSRKDMRSFSFQLFEATNHCQNLTFSSPGKGNSSRSDSFAAEERKGYPCGEDASDRKEKRLQRNRESARLSRRRRKQYLEVLENRVNYLCEEMDKGRREHVLSAIGQIEKLRSDLLQDLLEPEQGGVIEEGKMNDDSVDLDRLGDLDRKIQQLLHGGVLSRSSNELMLALTFGTQYLKSLVIPPHKKYVMWLTLQNELFFRGGRAASERLSAARIGEKLRSSGYRNVSPSNGMWPLFCNEIALSYDQEEKIRLLQKEVISNQETWLHRHTGASTEHVLESSRAAICGISNACEKRSKTLMDVLTPVQKAKFLAWMHQKRKQDASHLAQLVRSHFPACSPSSGEIRVDPKRHDAANLYILNHNLSVIAKVYDSSIQVPLSQEALKRFSRRPAFESLASVDEGKPSCTKGTLTKVGSSGALKRCSSELSCDVMNGRGYLKRSTSGTSLGVASSITPEAAQTTYSSYVYQALGSVKNLIPIHRLVRQTYSIQQHEPIQPLPVSSNATVLQDQSRQIPKVNYISQHLSSQMNQNHSSQMNQNHESTATAALPVSLLAPSQHQSQSQAFVSVPLPEPAPVVPSHRNTLLGSYLASAMDPLENAPITYVNNFSATREQHTYISTAASAPNFCSYSKVPSPVQFTSRDEDFGQIDDIGLWNVSNQLADDSLFDLTEEDWAIGEGAFLE